MPTPSACAPVIRLIAFIVLVLAAAALTYLGDSRGVLPETLRSALPVASATLAVLGSSFFAWIGIDSTLKTYALTLSRSLLGNTFGYRAVFLALLAYDVWAVIYVHRYEKFELVCEPSKATVVLLDRGLFLECGKEIYVDLAETFHASAEGRTDKSGKISDLLDENGGRIAKLTLQDWQCTIDRTERKDVYSRCGRSRYADDDRWLRYSTYSVTMKSTSSSAEISQLDAHIVAERLAAVAFRPTNEGCIVADSSKEFDVDTLTPIEGCVTTSKQSRILRFGLTICDSSSEGPSLLEAVHLYKDGRDEVRCDVQ